MIPNNLKNYLIAHGAAGTQHSGYTLWDHLAGVHRILEACDSEKEVCHAGLFHSVYGTQAFKTVTVDRRRRVEIQSLIGKRAEDLVWAFCALPRPKLFEVSGKQNTFGWLDQLETVGDKKQFWDDLVRLECANLLEQKKIHEFPYLAQSAQAMRMLDREGFSV